MLAQNTPVGAWHNKPWWRPSDRHIGSSRACHRSAGHALRPASWP